VIEPRIAIIGFGMAGVGAVHALRNVARFTSTGVQPRITIFEASTRPGGKVAPDNLGAQFLDADALYPFDRILDDLDVKTHRAREDYELVRLRLGNRSTIEAATFGHALAALRAAMSEALENSSFVDLDARTVAEVLHDLKRSGRMTDDGVAAMRQRMLLEDGTVKLSALAYALSLAKSPTPARRLEVKGGLYRVVVRERDAALEDDVTLVAHARVVEVEVGASFARVTYEAGASPAVDSRASVEAVAVEEFDAAIVAVSPEHLAGIRFRGSAPPIAPLLALEPARITKSNLLLKNPIRADEHATERYAMWFSRAAPSTRASSTTTMATFFHGWEGERPLSTVQMLKAALGVANPSRIVRQASRTWDASGVEHDVDAVPSGYISEPRVGQCVPLLRLSRAHYFRGAHDASALKLASHALGIGGGVREAALSGEWAAVATLRSLGCDVARAFERVDDVERELYGTSRAILARELD
jgi:hypothetical protein